MGVNIKLVICGVAFQVFRSQSLSRSKSRLKAHSLSPISEMVCPLTELC
jgi:hypothetical protein